MSQVNFAHRMKQRRRQRGVSLIEAVLSLLLISGVFVAAVNSVASARASHMLAADHIAGTLLAEQLMQEILDKAYMEEGTVVIGTDGGENSGKRCDRFDDVDDYNGWSASPPIDVNGNVIPGYASYTRSVAVVWGDAWDRDSTSLTDSGVKRIVVTVSLNGKAVAQVTGFRTNEWVDPASP